MFINHWIERDNKRGASLLAYVTFYTIHKVMKILFLNSFLLNSIIFATVCAVHANKNDILSILKNM